MNNEIQIGEYVRTNNARGIRKVARINEAATVNRYLFIDGYDHSDTIYGIIRADQITKHDFNIIKLIEVGDYVNGYLVEAIDYEEDENGNLFNVLGVVFTDDDFAYREELENINIHSIVTKEQFKAMEYVLGGKEE